MAFEPEAGGEQGGDPAGAAVDFEGFAAGAALEMVVVLLSGQFVPGRLAGEFDLDDLTELLEGFDSAIDRGE